MTLSTVRPVTLAVVRSDRSLLFALSDGHAVARFGTVSADDALLKSLGLTERVLWRGADGGLDCATLGYRLFSALLPQSVREFLVASPSRHLTLQLQADLMPIPWELAFDGESFLSQKFAIARQLVDGSDIPQASGRGRRVSSQPRLLALRSGLSDNRACLDDYKSVVDVVSGVGVTVIEHSELSGPAVQAELADGAALRCSWSDATHVLATLQATGRDILPRLIVIDAKGLSPSQVAGSPFVRSVGALVARSCDVIVLCASEDLDMAFEQELLQGLAAGLPVGDAVRRAHVAESGEALAILYGDGERSVWPGTARNRANDDQRQLSALFYDLVESTRLLDAIGGERYSELLAQFHQRCARIVSHYGGLANDPRGNDGVMCYFGYPIAAEDSAIRAIRAGLEIVAVSTELELQSRVGISTGRVVIREGQPYGTSVHRAARLQSYAEPGTVVVSDATLKLARNRFDAELLEAATLKGLRQPGRMYRVLAERQGELIDANSIAPSLTPLIGRERELQLLHEQWSESVAGALRVVQIIGEAGIGKSRLVREFRERVEGDGATVIECRCSPDHAASAFHPVIDYLRRALSVRDGDTDEVKIQKITTAVGTLPEGDETTWLIARLLSVRLERQQGPIDMTPERLRERTLEALLRWLAHLAEQAPVCMIVEDVNWMDPSSREYLRRLVTRGARHPLLVVLTQRSGAVDRWEPPVLAPRVELRGLPPEQARELVMAVSRGRKLSNQAVRALAERGDGVPLFIEESTRMAVEANAAVDKAEDGQGLSVPSTIQDLLTARLDNLGNARAIAQLGATIGREFPVTLLEAVLEHGAVPVRVADLPSKLRTLVASGMVIEKGEGQDRRYYFRHALVREAAYQSLWERDRARLHRAIAEVITHRFRGLAESQPELMAYHFTEARIDTEALEYWERAARLAASRWANDEAISHLNSALELVGRVTPGPDRDRIELRLLLLLAARLIATEGYGAPQVEGMYRRALDIAQALGDDTALSKVQLGLEGFHFMRGDFAEAQKYARQAETLVANTTNPMPRLQARWAVANILFHQGEVAEAVKYMDDCLQAYDQVGHRASAVQDPGVMCLCYSAWGLWELGFPDRALERARRVVELADSLQHRFSMGEASGFRTTVHCFRGEYAEARQWAERGIAICEDGGFVVWLAHARVMYGRILAELGEHAAGLTEMRRGYQMWADSGAVVTRPFYLAMQAEGLALAGRNSEGLQLLGEAMQLIDKHGERYYEAEIRRLVGRLLLAGGAQTPAVANEAEGWLVSSLRIAEQRRLHSLALRTAMDLAELWDGAGRSAAALRILAPARAAVDEGDQTADARRADGLLQRMRQPATTER